MPTEPPSSLSDDTAAQLIECLRELAEQVESLRAEHRALCAAAFDQRQMALWPEHELPF